MNVLVISPHLDDAVLCAGGRIAQHAADGHSVTVLTVFAGRVPPTHLTEVARKFHWDCGLGDDAVTTRRREDLAAMAWLGAQCSWLGFADGIYRLPAGDSVSDRLLFGERLAEPPLLEAGRREISTHLSGVGEILIPLSVGGHVDHIMARRMTELACSAAAVTRVSYYEESLYETQLGAAAWAKVRTAGLHRHQWSLPLGILHRKLRAAEAYESQLRMLGAGTEAPAARKAFFDHLGTERIWTVRYPQDHSAARPSEHWPDGH